MYRQLLYLLMFQSSIEPFTLSICYFQLSNYWINVIVMHFNRIITTNWVIDAEKQAVPSETLISFFCFAVCVFFLALCFLYSIYCLYFLRFSFDYDVVTIFELKISYCPFGLTIFYNELQNNGAHFEHVGFISMFSSPITTCRFTYDINGLTLPMIWHIRRSV